MSDYEPDHDEPKQNEGMEIEVQLRPGITESPPVIKKKTHVKDDYSDPRIKSCAKIYSQSKLRQKSLSRMDDLTNINSSISSKWVVIAKFLEIVSDPVKKVIEEKVAIRKLS